MGNKKSIYTSIFYVPLPFCLVIFGEFIKQHGIHLHECLENIEYQRDDSLIPMFTRYPIEGGEENRQKNFIILLNQRHQVLIVPVVESPLCNLQNKQKIIR